MQYVQDKSETSREICCKHTGIPAFEKRHPSNHTITSVDVIVNLLDYNPDLAFMRFVTYRQKERAAVARRLDVIKDAFLRHNDDDRQHLSIARSHLRKQEILRMCSTLTPRTCLAVASEVQSFSSERKFIPMLDFVCEKSEENKQFLVELLSELNTREDLKGGFLVESYSSYHYYGRSVVSLEKWTRFVGFSLLMHPPLHYRPPAKRAHVASVIDVRHLGHSLIRGDSALRISANPDGHLPRVVAKVGSSH